MKLLKKFMAVALISTALTGASFAVHNMADQANDTVDNIADLGFVKGAKQLLITKESIASFYDGTNPFDPAAGKSQGVKNAKAFLKSVIDGTAAKFDGANDGEKKTAFLAALNKVLDVTEPLDLNIDVVGFNVGKAPEAKHINPAIDIFFEAISPEDPRETLLKQAELLSIKAEAADGTTVESLLQELAAAGTDKTARGLVLDKVAALNDLGKGNDKTLQQKVDARLAKHDASGTGKYKDIGLDKDVNKIGKFHAALQDKAGATGGSADPKVAKFIDDVKLLFDDGVLTGDGSSLDTILSSFQALGDKISTLEGALAKMAGGAKGQKFTVVPSTSGSHAQVIPQEHNLGGSAFKGGMN